MAASLLGRVFVSQHAKCKVFRTLSSLQFRLFSSDDTVKGSGNTSEYDGNQSASAPRSTGNQEAEQPLVEQLSPSSTSNISAADIPRPEGAIDKFSKVIEKVKKAQEAEESPVDIEPEVTTPEDPNESFASMLRKSKFVSLGELKDRLVRGKVFEVMGDDLYIDFGGKFHCVCPRPKQNADFYCRGTTVKLRLQCMEMSSAFLGSDIHVTLLEADAILLGRIRSATKEADSSSSSSASP